MKKSSARERARMQLRLVQRIDRMIPQCRSLNAAVHRVLKHRGRHGGYGPSSVHATRLYKRWIKADRPAGPECFLPNWKPGGPQKIFSPLELNREALRIAAGAKTFLEIFEELSLFASNISVALRRSQAEGNEGHQLFTYRTFLLRLFPDTKEVIRKHFAARRRFEAARQAMAESERALQERTRPHGRQAGKGRK